MNDSEKKDAAEVLERAADLLWVKGRCTGSTIGDDGRLCALGAIDVALHGETSSSWQRASFSAPGLALRDYIAAHDETHNEWTRRVRDTVEANGNAYPVFLWNDGHRPSPENDDLVIDTIRRCAKELRA